MKSSIWVLVGLAALLLASCGAENRSDGDQSRTARTRDTAADLAERPPTPEDGSPREWANRFREAIDEATTAQDFDGAVAQIRKMSDYMSSLSDNERWDFVSHWEDPPFQTWLEQTTATLEADAVRNLEQRTDKKN